MVTVPQGLRAGDRFVATIPPPRGATVTPSDGAPRRGKLVTLPADFLQSFSAYKSTSAAGRLNLDFNAGRRPLQGRATPRSTSRRRSSCNTRTAAAPPRPPPRRGPPPARANGRSRPSRVRAGPSPRRRAATRACSTRPRRAPPPPRARRRVGGPRRLGSEEQGQARRGRLRPRRDRRAALRPPRPVGRARRPRARAGVERRGDSTPSTRRCPSGRVGSMAWRLTKVHRNISHWLISTQAGEPAPPGPRPGPVAAGAFAARCRDGLPVQEVGVCRCGGSRGIARNTGKIYRRRLLTLIIDRRLDRGARELRRRGDGERPRRPALLLQAAI